MDRKSRESIRRGGRRSSRRSRRSRRSSSSSSRRSTNVDPPNVATPGQRTWLAGAANWPHHKRAAVGCHTRFCRPKAAAAGHERIEGAIASRQVCMHVKQSHIRECLPSTEFSPASGPPKPCSEVTARQFCPAILLDALCGMGQRPLGACAAAGVHGWQQHQGARRLAWMTHCPACGSSRHPPA